MHQLTIADSPKTGQIPKCAKHHGRSTRHNEPRPQTAFWVVQLRGLFGLLLPAISVQRALATGYAVLLLVRHGFFLKYCRHREIWKAVGLDQCSNEGRALKNVDSNRTKSTRRRFQGKHAFLRPRARIMSLHDCDFIHSSVVSPEYRSINEACKSKVGLGVCPEWG